MAQKTAAKAGKKAPVDKAKLSLKNVLPLNLEQERDQLLASFAAATKDDQEKGEAASK